MNKTAVILMATFAGGLLFGASAALPARGEMKVRDKWLARHFDGETAALPFSFTSGGRPSRELLPTWELERAKAKPGGGSPHAAA